MSLANTKEFIKKNKDVKFYKITNSMENHNGFQFETGLNVDTVPFKPLGKCLPGGIYFTDFTNFPYWVTYTVDLHWVRPVTFPEDCQIYIEDKKYKADKLILGEPITLYEFYNSLSEDEIISHMKLNPYAIGFVTNLTESICNVAFKKSIGSYWYLSKENRDKWLFLKRME